jgi:hypothetical protein
MKTRRTTNFRRFCGSGAPSTVVQLIRPGRNTHEANFRRILPGAMDKLVEEGLFERDGDSYKITLLGQQRLVELEQ